MSQEIVEKKFFNNKHLIHIVSEIVVFVGISIYFSSKNTKLSKHIEDLAQRLEEQEDRIQKLESTIQQIISKNLPEFVLQINNCDTRLKNIEEYGNSKSKHKFKPIPKTIVKEITPVKFDMKDIEEYIEKNSEENMDDEIRSELEELELEDQYDLKKEN